MSYPPSVITKDGNRSELWKRIRITPFTTFLLEYEYGFKCSRIQIQNICLESGNTFRYLLDLQDNIYQFSLLIIHNYKII
jgi:hypothetical protein